MPIFPTTPEGVDTRKISYPTDDGKFPEQVYAYEEEAIAAMETAINAIEKAQREARRAQTEYEYIPTKTGYYAGKIWNREDLPIYARWLGNNPRALAELGFIHNPWKTEEQMRNEEDPALDLFYGRPSGVVTEMRVQEFEESLFAGRAEVMSYQKKIG